MNFELDEEQSALKDSLARLHADRYTFEKRRALAASAAGHDQGTWDKLAELGLTALPLPEAHGGFGGGARDLLPVMQEMGRALSLEPYLPTVLGATALRLAGSDAQQARWLPGVASGATRLAWAHDEEAARHAPLAVATRAVQGVNGWTLEGSKTNVLGGAFAHHFIVSARTDAGLGLFLLDATEPGVQARHYRLVDDGHASELTLRGVQAQRLEGAGDATAAIEATLAAGIAAACADMVGAMQAAYELAIAYLNTRKQFGRLIGENQALRHRAADMLVSLEMARSMAMAAAVAVDDPEDESSRADLHRAKLSVGRHARALAHSAIQCHGGIGMTEEYAVGHSLRRIHVMDQLFGDADAHAAQLAALS